MNIRLTNKQKVMLAPLGQLVDGLIRNQDEFISKLAEELMLDELLCGECDSKQFLIETMERLVHEQRIETFERMLERAKGVPDEI